VATDNPSTVVASRRQVGRRSISLSRVRSADRYPLTSSYCTILIICTVRPSVRLSVCLSVSVCARVQTVSAAAILTRRRARGSVVCANSVASRHAFVELFRRHSHQPAFRFSHCAVPLTVHSFRSWRRVRVIFLERFSVLADGQPPLLRFVVDQIRKKSK